MSPRNRSSVAYVALCGAIPAVLLATYVLYEPGLTGGFILDDYPNLGRLADFADRDTRDRIVAFVLSGGSGPTGRPLSLASFLVNDTAWPSSPLPFKYTNVMFHLLNGALVCWFSFLLGSHAPWNEQHVGGIALPCALAVFAMAAWLLHPLNVSTVLYVVQRMTMLAAMFSLLGAIGYLKARSLALRRPVLGYLLMSLAVIGGTAAGAVSKENGVLLPLFILVMEVTVLARTRPLRWWLWATVFLGLPVLALIVWHVVSYPSISAGYDIRAFTMAERLLTESRVLWTYLGLILFPRAAGTGIFHDDFPLSYGWLDPPTTLFAALGIGAIAVLAMYVRRREPWLAFGILWYLAGHVIESGIVPLEIYFEHRNYLPMLGPLVTLAYYILTLGRRFHWQGLVAGAAFLAFASLATWENTRVWGSTALHAEVALAEHPDSHRAATFSADQWLRAGRLDMAYSRLQQLLTTHPDLASVHLQLLLLDCAMGQTITPTRVDDLLTIFRRSRPDHAVRATLDALMRLALSGNCTGWGHGDLSRVLSTLLQNPAVADRNLRAYLYMKQANLRWLQHDLAGAIESADSGYRSERTIENALVLTSLYMEAGDRDHAKKYLSMAETRDQNRRFGVRIYKDEIEEMKRRLGQF